MAKAIFRDCSKEKDTVTYVGSMIITGRNLNPYYRDHPPEREGQRIGSRPDTPQCRLR